MPRPGSLGVVTDRFGPRINPVTGVPGNHDGEDTAPPGNVFPVTGTIVFKGYVGGWGNIIGIREEASPSVIWWVAHNANLGPHPVGTRGNEGDDLAPVGSTGNSTGPHAHTERRVGGSAYPGTGTATDPRPYYGSAAGGGGTSITSQGEKRMLIVQGSTTGAEYKFLYDPLLDLRSVTLNGRQISLAGYAGIPTITMEQASMDAIPYGLEAAVREQSADLGPVVRSAISDALKGVAVDVDASKIAAATASAVSAILAAPFAKVNANIDDQPVVFELTPKK